MKVWVLWHFLVAIRVRTKVKVIGELSERDVKLSGSQSASQLVSWLVGQLADWSVNQRVSHSVSQTLPQWFVAGDYQIQQVQ